MTQIPEVTRRLGRHINHDPASFGYRAETAAGIKSAWHQTHDLPLNQGQIGSCTGNALAGALNTAPNYSGRPRTEADAVQLYEWETAMEGQPYPPNDPGGSGLNVCTVAQQHGWITSYTHAFGIEGALLALVLRPVITGVNWYDSFDNPIAGQISIGPGATVRGGHEFLVYRLDVPEGATIDDLDKITVHCVNSWGKSWGNNGHFTMVAATWATLLDEQGDVTVPVR